MPAEPLTVARYLAVRAGDGASIATLRLATSPGAVSAMRIVFCLLRRQFRFKTKRRNDGYDTGHPRASSNSRMRVSCSRSPVSHW